MSPHGGRVAVFKAAFWAASVIFLLSAGSYGSILDIEQAFLRGEISYETALVYKAYTLFEPSKLPEDYLSLIHI